MLFFSLLSLIQPKFLELEISEILTLKKAFLSYCFPEVPATLPPNNMHLQILFGRPKSSQRISLGGILFGNRFHVFFVIFRDRVRFMLAIQKGVIRVGAALFGKLGGNWA